MDLLRQITIRYVLVLSLLATFTVGGLGVFWTMIEQQRQFGAAAAMAAKVRPVSQRVALLSLALATRFEHAEANPSLADQIRALVAACKSNYDSLRALTPQVTTLAEVEDILAIDSPFSRALTQYQETALRVVASDAAARQHDETHRLLELSPAVLAGSDRLVKLLETEAAKQVALLQGAAVAGASAVVILLCVSAFGIFRPMARKLAHQFDDIAAAKRLAEQAARSKSDFLAVMSHEVRTPMNGIIGMVRLALDDCREPQRRAQLETALFSAESLLTILNDILDFSKIESGRLDIEAVPYAPTEVFDMVARLMKERAAEKGLVLTLDVDPALPPLLRGDPTRLRQIMLNLVGNAVKFTERGEVAITVEVAAGADGPLMRVEVADTGIGIAADTLDHLFHQFSQADASMARRFGGTGLGLAISKRLCELMGGRIGVVSTLGEGSTFWFELPLAAVDAEEARRDGEAVAPPLMRRLRILLAEDNLINQKVAAGLIGRHHDLTIVGTGKDAVAACADQDFDVVLMDMQMPEMDGLEATKHIRALGGRRGAIPIIAMTANAMKGDDERCFAAGMNDYVAKPIVPQALFAALARQVSAFRASEEAKAFDALRFEELRLLLGQSEIDGLTAELERQARATVAALREGPGAERLLELAHDLKAASGTFGLAGVHDLAAAVELACRDGHFAEACRLAEGLPERIEQGLAELAAVNPLDDPTRGAGAWVVI